MKLSVVIPTYMRAQEIDRCLSGLAEQQRPPDQVVVIVRNDDRETPSVVQKWANRLPVETWTIQIPGVVQALNLGLQQVTGDIVTITDDDTFALPDWLSRIEQHFLDDPRLGGLGGRDIIHERGVILEPNTEQVGLVLPYGRLIGNHHLGLGGPREVDHLKGVNMSFRIAAIEGMQFDTGLRGKGAQVYFELAFAFEVKRRGWRIVYDPAILVHHYLALRHDHDVRGDPDIQADANAAYNLAVAVRRYMQPGFKRTLTLLWVRYIGAFGHPGLLRGLWFRLTGNQYRVRLAAAVSRSWREAKETCAHDNVPHRSRRSL